MSHTTFPSSTELERLKFRSWPNEAGRTCRSLRPPVRPYVLKKVFSSLNEIWYVGRLVVVEIDEW